MTRAIIPVLLAALVVGACGGGEERGAAGEPASAGEPAAAADAPTVTIKTFIFKPKPLTVKAGTTVAFRNEDSALHTVTAGTRSKPQKQVFDEEVPEKGGTTEWTLDEPGRYRYFCDLHSGDGMTGEIVVE